MDSIEYYQCGGYWCAEWEGFALVAPATGITNRIECEQLANARSKMVLMWEWGEK